MGAKMARFIPGSTPLVFPAGTITAHIKTTWAMYINRRLHTTWIGYAMPGGTRLIQLPGIRSGIASDVKNIQAFVTQRQATACGECGS